MRLYKYADFGKGALIKAEDLQDTISDERLDPTIYNEPKEHLVRGFEHVTEKIEHQDHSLN